MQWKQISITSFSMITSRKNHSSCIYKKFLFVYGGIDDKFRILDDLWKLDLK